MNRKHRIGIITIISMFMGILIIPALIVAPFIGKNDTASVEETTAASDSSTVDIPASLSPFSINVMRATSEKVEEVPLEDYVARVVASEMPANFELEALKAQALAARTYITQQLTDGEPYSEQADVTDTTQHQVYKNEDELREQWKEQYSKNMSRINQAVKETAGEIITYEEEPITAAFFSTSNGYTENSEDYWENEIPYLKSVESPWDEDSPKFFDQKVVPIAELESALNVKIANGLENINLAKTPGGRVAELSVGEQKFTGREIREKLNLQSSDFTIEQKENHIIFTTRGYGHGVGMSQYGANGMAEAGKTYKEIIKHYYQNTEITPVSKQTASLS
ncbi:stage II sporulation protein D [Halobacillus sp. A5]|uniref:stage II sporulation protein D n=1 Tax=Halobacillus sp. A5 TaxID=2880263 RepID=UPI0020A64825|nr:stage II sporulation protein D [Halobacillus sp. A5]MCP3027591.1 stage II sporulation protein D [Halobacillus sp. A5]